MIDFDGDKIRATLRKHYQIQKTFVENPGELTVHVHGVEITFYKYPFKIDFSEKLNDIVKFPNLLTLASMKTFTLGKRAKWKDYVDLYFIPSDLKTAGESRR